MARVRLLSANNTQSILELVLNEGKNREIRRLLQALGFQVNRLVRIHGVGFPTMFGPPAQSSYTGIRFATLMRELARRNGGTFLGLNSTQR